MRTNFPGSRKTWVLAVLVASGLLLVQAGALPLWVWALVAALVVATQVLAHADRYRDQLFVSEEGLSREHGSRLRKTLTESVRWDELAKVEVLANETGAGRKEMLFLLYGRTGQGVAVPGSVASSHDLVAVLEGRLPGFRKDAVAEAQRSAERRSWTLWERPPP
ncbi:hypothetical protein [Ramlibacter sp. AN1133]|uniref:hypothetical protein n=1 Tax=Ramlibacter sp. AN1133 TaxID=3133429 RepID=UPI0030BBD035